eukprot:tig00021070_g17837.t1
MRIAGGVGVPPPLVPSPELSNAPLCMKAGRQSAAAELEQLYPHRPPDLGGPRHQQLREAYPRPRVPGSLGFWFSPASSASLLPPSSVPRSAAAPIRGGRRPTGRLAGGRVLAAGPDAAGLVGRAGTAADGLAAALEAADPRLLPVDLSPRGDPAPIPRLSAISPRRLPLASPPAPDEAPSPAPAASPGLSASPFASASEEKRRTPSSGGAGGPSTSGGEEEESLRAGSAFAPAAEEGEGDEAAPAPAAPLGKAARRKKKKGQ